jgi:hypothetical protein
VTLDFSFKVNSDDTVTVIRDGKGSQVSSISGSSGVYTITFKSTARLPRQLTSFDVNVSQPSSALAFNQAHIVTDSYDVSARTVQVVCTEYADGTASVVKPATGSWVSVELTGPMRDDLKDAA